MSGILSGFVKGIKSIGEETVEKTVEHTGKIAGGIITGQELIGNIKPMTETERQKALQEDEKMKQEYMGRNVEQEIEKVREEKKGKEEEEERFLKNLERQRQNEATEREQLNANVPTNSKKEVAKHLGQKSRKAQMPDPASMSATGEMTGGKID